MAIVSIAAGSVSVETVVTFDSLEADGGVGVVEDKAVAFVDVLTAAPAEVFKTAPLFETFGAVSTPKVEKVH